MMSCLTEHGSRIVRLSFSLLLSLLLAGVSPAWGEMTERLVFPEATCVEGSVIQLGHLAEAHGPESTIFLEHFSRLKVADAPSRKGNRKIITADMVREALSQVASVPGSLDIPSQIIVQRGGRVISFAAMRKESAKFLTQAFASLEAEVNIRDYRLPERLFASDTKSSVAVESSRKIKPGRVSFRINVLDGAGRITQRVSASAFVDVWVSAPCAARPLNRGNVLVPTSVRFERKNLAYLRGSVWNGRGGPWRVKRPMGTGEVVYDKNIELMPTIVQGSRVSLVFESRTIRLEVPAEALEDGQLGKSIMVRNLQSNKQILAEVKDQDTVIVH